MASSTSKDILKAKKICAYLRPANRWLLDLIYAEAEKAGCFPLPDKAVAALWRTVKVIVEGEKPPQPPHLRDQPGVSIDATDDLPALASRIYQQAYHDAVAAYLRHRPDLKIRKGRPGRKPNVELAERIWALHDAPKTSRKIQQILAAEGVNLTLEAIEAYLKTRRRKPQQ